MSPGPYRWMMLCTNAAVIVAIALVWLELDRNTRTMRAMIDQSRVADRAARHNDMMLSDHWPAIQVKEAKTGSAEEWVASLTPEEFHRVRTYLLLELSDVRHQHYQYRRGFLDQRTWDTETRDQITRMLAPMPYFVPTMTAIDAELRAALNEIARDEGLPLIKENGGWVVQ